MNRKLIRNKPTTLIHTIPLRLYCAWHTFSSLCNINNLGAAVTQRIRIVVIVVVISRELLKHIGSLEYKILFIVCEIFVFFCMYHLHDLILEIFASLPWTIYVYESCWFDLISSWISLIHHTEMTIQTTNNKPIHIQDENGRKQKKAGGRQIDYYERTKEQWICVEHYVDAKL